MYVRLALCLTFLVSLKLAMIIIVKNKSFTFLWKEIYPQKQEYYEKDLFTISPV